MTPLYKPYMYLPLHRVDFVHFGLESGVGSRKLEECMNISVGKKGQDLENRAIHPNHTFLGVPPGQH